MALTLMTAGESFKLAAGQALPADAGAPQLTCGRNDFAACSLILRSDEDAVLSLTEAPFFSRHGDRPLYRIAVQCAELACALQMTGMNDDDDGVSKADILLEGDAFPLEAGVPAQLFLRIHAPAGCAPGVYTGSVTVLSRRLFASESPLLTLPLSVRVRDVLLPGGPQSAFHLDLWQHYANIARKHEVPLFSEAHFALLESYMKGLSELGQKAVTLIATDIPWSGQFSFHDQEYVSDLYEYSMVAVERDGAGLYHYDFSVAARILSMAARYGMDREIEVFGLCNIWMDEEAGFGKAAPGWPDGVRVRYFDRVDGLYRYMDRAEDITGYIAALEGWFERKGLLDRVLIVADEPANMDRYRASLNAVRAAAPQFRFKTAINHAEFIAEFSDIVADYVPSLGSACAEWDALMAARRQITGRLLWYVCCGPPYPNTFIGSPLVESALIGYLTDYMGMDGFLRWNYTVWPDDPRRHICFRPGSWHSGDTNFVYPSFGGRPLYSLRYWALRRGIGCFELCRMVRERCPEAREVLESVYGLLIREPDMRKWRFDLADPTVLFSRNPEDYDEARSLLLDALESCPQEN